MKPNFQTFGEINSDWTMPWSGALLTRQHDRVLEQKGNDLQIYDQVLRDDQVFASLQQRFLLQTSLEWVLEPGGDTSADLKSYEFIKSLVDSIPFDQICNYMLYSIFYGYSVAEVMLKYENRLVTLDLEQEGIRVRNRRRFWFDRQGNTRLRTSNNYEGIVLDPSRVWKISTGGTHSDDPYGCGLAYWLFWPCFFKRGDIRLWLQSIEADASGRPISKYPTQASEQEKNEARDVAIALGEGKPFAISENTIVDLLGKVSSNGVSNKELLGVCDGAISKIILSQTMTLDNGSSLAQAEVHKDVLDAIVKSDADLLCASFNAAVIKPLSQWNFDGATPPKLWRKPVSNNDRKLEAETDGILFTFGYRPTEKRIEEVYGADYELVAVPTPPQIESSSPQFTEAKTIRSGGVYEVAETDPDSVDLMVARTIKMSRPFLKKWSDKLRKNLEEAETLEAFAEALPDYFEDLESEDLEQVLAQALQASQLAGIYESGEGVA